MKKDDCIEPKSSTRGSFSSAKLKPIKLVPPFPEENWRMRALSLLMLTLQWDGSQSSFKENEN